MENSNKKLAELEALLFIHGEPLTVKKIAAVLDIDAAKAQSLLEEFKRKLEAEDRGLALVSDEDPSISLDAARDKLLGAGRVQLTTKPQFGKILEKFVKEELSEDLTPASLEALAIVAYFAPISRARLEYLRGVNSIFILRSLLLRGLVERYPDPRRANAYLYKPTFDLLKHLGVKSREELPEFKKFQELLRRFESQSEIKQSEQPEPHPNATNEPE